MYCTAPKTRSFLTVTIILQHDRQSTCKNIEARSYKYCCSEEEINITYFECVFVVLSIQHAMCMYHIIIPGLTGCKIFLHIICKKARISEKKFELKIVFIFSMTFVRNMSNCRGTERDFIKNVILP